MAPSACARPRAARGVALGCWRQEGRAQGGITGLLCSRTNGQCQNITVVLHKTSEPGKYTACESWSLSLAVPCMYWGRGWLHEAGADSQPEKSAPA